MFCRNCGKEIPKTTKFCPYCGASHDIAIHPKSNDEDKDRMISQYDRENAYPAYSIMQNEKQPNHRKIGIIACVVVALIVIASVATENANSPKSIVEKYIKAERIEDYETMLEYSAVDMNSIPRQYQEYWEEMVDYSYLSRETIIDSIKSNYGRNYKITTSALKVTRLSSSDMKSKIASLKYSFDIYSDDSLVPWNKIKEISLVQGELTIKGNLREDTTPFELYCAKIDGKWKVLGDFDRGF